MNFAIPQLNKNIGIQNLKGVPPQTKKNIMQIKLIKTSKTWVQDPRMR